MNIPTLVEGARGCGYRKPGGKYLVSGQLSEPCPKLPIELHVCPVCHSGIKPSRGWTWIKPDPFTDPGPHAGDPHDAVCPFGAPGRIGERCGLLWIGESFYKTPEAFAREAATVGVSRRISAVPKDFVLGETWALVAHRKAIPGECEHGAPAGTPCSKCPKGESAGEWHHGIFSAFKPERIEYVVRGDETEEDLEAMVADGITPVRVVRAEQETL